MKPSRHHPLALVPEFLTKLTIEKIPYDVPHYVKPGERDDYEAPAMFVTDDRQLKVGKGFAFDVFDDAPPNPVGLAGVMRVAHPDPERGMRVAYVADLRFLGLHDLVEADDIAGDLGEDQEQFMHLASLVENAVTIDAFIATQDDFDPADEIAKGEFYGDEALYPYLKQLRKVSNKHLRQFVNAQAVSPATASASEQVQSSDEQIPEKPGSQPKKLNLSVLFSNR